MTAIQQEASELIIRTPVATDPEVLTLDPSPTATGWARGRNRERWMGGTRSWFVECGVTFKTPGWCGAVGLAYSRFVQYQLTAFPVRKLWIELPAMPSPERYNIWHSGFVIHQFFKAIELAELAGIPWQEVPTTSLKAWALGRGRGFAKAKQLIPWCRSAGYAVESEHQAVAVALLEWSRARPDAQAARGNGAG